MFVFVNFLFAFILQLFMKLNRKQVLYMSVSPFFKYDYWNGYLFC